MTRTLRARTNDAWIDALSERGPGYSTLLDELGSFLRKIVGKTATGRLEPDEVGDLVQESLARILGSLDTFRGDAAFPTWAAAITTRVVLTELRRRRARDTDEFSSIQEEAVEPVGPDSARPDALAARSQLHVALEEAIRTRLTERQRVAIMAELRGIPTIEIADRLNTNQNALYKLTHDARKRLKSALEEAGFTAEHIHERVTEATR